ncbi:MAG TPA: hypothetical protein VKR06_39005 [Ktedonosporobacter sp.]|nr:hypothetical protein [Ktedonosporobacter sp.]
MTRLLLPFTHGVDTQAIDVAVRFAHYHQATLVPLALIPSSPGRWFSPGPRLEAFQQAQDFFEVVRHKAERHAVPVEPVQLVTPTIIESIFSSAHEQTCEQILLFMRQKKGLLLTTREITSLLKGRKYSISLIHLFAPQGKRKRGAPAFPLQLDLDSATLANSMQPQEAPLAIPITIHVETHTTSAEEVKRITI